VRVSGGGIKQFGEPFYFYVLEFYLEPQSELLINDSVTLHLLPGVHTPGSASSAPNGPPDPSGPWTPVYTNEPSGLLPNYSPPTTVPFADVTFYNAFNPVQNTDPTHEKYLGEFRVLTAISLPMLPPDYFTEIDWTAKLHTSDGVPITDSGSVILHLIIPEPTSLMLLGVGVGFPLCWTIRRRLNH
jgi:hypothetical protein